MSGAIIVNDYIKNSTLKVVVKPNSNKTEILGFDKEKQALKISLSKPAEDNKANIELIKFISRMLKCKVKILKGITSKEKVLKIEK